MTQSGRGLRELAAGSGRYFGSAVRLGQLKYEADFRQVFEFECSCLTPEISLKWGAIERERGVLDLAETDELVQWAQARGLAIRGHTLLWHQSVPGWLERLLEERPDWSIVEQFFGTVLCRYGNAIQEWDVVNEPIETGFRNDGLRQNAFLRAFGPDYIRRSLEEARRWAPHAKLMINEYGLEYDIRVEQDRRYLFLKLLESLKKAGAPLDGVGLQGHLDLGKGTVSERIYAEFIREIADLGLMIVITELDVKEHQYTLLVEERDHVVAAETRRFLDIVLAQAAVKGIVTWGLSDRHSWLEVTGADYTRFPNAWTKGDGPGFNRGLPYDSSMRPKPMRHAIQAALSACSSC